MKTALIVAGGFFVYWEATHPATLPNGQSGFPLGYIIGAALLYFGLKK